MIESEPVEITLSSIIPSNPHGNHEAHTEKVLPMCSALSGAPLRCSSMVSKENPGESHISPIFL